MKSLGLALYPLVIATVGCSPVAQSAASHSAPAAQSHDWREAERGVLENHVQLTFSDRFVKAGESYFSPDDSKVIFQAVEQPEGGGEPDPFYAMFVADVVRNQATGHIESLANFKRISPKHSANTCGWFHPTDPHIVIFGSTLTRPSDDAPPGFQRGTSRYKWMFPKEMRIVQCDLRSADGTVASLQILAGDGSAYTAECSLDATARHLLFCSLQSNEGDLFVKDMTTNNTHRIVQARGYDGGPFFSPDGKLICYRSDRRGDHYLQLYVADLAFNQQGEIIGIQREYMLTDDGSVNWAPFWTRDGRRLVYASSTVSHSNYEVFMIDADPGNLPHSTGTIRYGTAKRRITHADGADVLPAFSNDGKTMIWTSQRAIREDGQRSDSQLWAADFVLDPDAVTRPADVRPPQREPEQRVSVEDPQTGRVLVYDLTTHTLSEYDPRTHKLTPTNDPADIELFHKLRAAKSQREGE